MLELKKICYAVSTTFFRSKVVFRDNREKISSNLVHYLYILLAFRINKNWNGFNTQPINSKNIIPHIPDLRFLTIKIFDSLMFELVKLCGRVLILYTEILLKYSD